MIRLVGPALWVLAGCASIRDPRPAMEHVTVAADQSSFVLAPSGTPFVPWGFNYDHDAEGALLEDYWDSDWPRVEADFHEMAELGANLVRVHLQLGRFMVSAELANDRALDQLARLVRLAEDLRLRLDLTGLGCYHAADVPPWYDALDEAQRWNTQARFWAAIAARCAKSPAIFCYDLMNEPVVPGGSAPQPNWLGPPFAGKHFVQFITRDRGGRARPDIARTWVHRLVTAIRAHDPHHLVTVGLVPWSLDRPGLTSGFVPGAIADELDFLAVHLYPEAGKLEESLVTLQGFAIGKPVIIEETFPLACSPAELATFLARSRLHARGWIGFYWGRTPDELRRSATIADALMLGWLELFARGPPAPSRSG